jgi:hypothetical protein
MVPRPLTASEKAPMIIIPNGVMNLSAIECLKKEEFLATERASE